MAENTFTTDYELNTAQARKELEELRKSLGGVTLNLDHSIDVSLKGAQKLKKALDEIVALQANGSPAQQARAQARADQIERSYYTRVGQSTNLNGRSAQGNNVSRAASQAMIADIQNTTAAATARVTDAIVKQMTSILRSSEAAVEARIRSANFASGQNVANSDSRYLAARGRLAEERRNDTIYAGENGRAALASRNRIENLNYNGGADLMGIQGRVMMNYMAVGGIFNAAKSMTSGIVELDKELKQFQAISTATNREMGAFKKNLVDISATVPFTTLEITQAATMLAQAGLSTTEVTQSLGSISKFATATGSELSQAVDLVTSSLTAFNLETSQTGQVADIFTSALNLSKLSVDKMVTALNYIGPTASEVGLTLQETTAILGALSQSGVRASTMGTGFRALLTDLQSPSKKLMEVMKAAGLSIDDINVKTKGFLPVLETLKKAGFGAAEAYESLETRSAATYIALSNNTEMAYEMQRAFTVSAAATAANDIQMKSLSNTAKNLGSIVTAAAYTGMEPILNVTQQLLASTASVLSVLNDYPAVLTGIGAVASGVGVILAGSLGMSLLRSLTTMIPVIGNVKTGLTLMATEAAMATTVVGGLGRALSVLKLISMGTWIGLIATGAAAVAVAFATWKGEAETLADRIDSLKGRVNDLDGAADASSKKLTALDQALRGVVDRRAELETNELMRGAKIDELRMQFHELGLSIKNDTMSVTDLIRELNNLKSTSERTRASQLAEVVNGRKDTIKALEDQQAMLFNPKGKTANSLRDDTTRLITGRRQAVYDDTLDFYVKQIGEKLSPAIEQALRFAMGNKDVLGGDPLLARDLNAAVVSMLGDVTRRGDPNEQPTEIFLTKLQKALEPLVANTLNLESERGNLRQDETNQKIASMRSSSAFQTMQMAADRVQVDLEAKRRDINSSQMTNAQKDEALKALDTWLQEQTTKTIEEFKLHFSADPTMAGLDPKNLISEAQGNLEALGLSNKTAENALQKELIKTQTRELRESKAQQGKDLGRWQRQVGQALNSDMLKAASEGYKSTMEATRDSILAMYDELIERNKGNGEELSKLREDRQDFIEEMGAQIEVQDRDVARKENDLLKDSLERQKDAVEDNIKGLEKGIEAALKELKGMSPGAAMDALVQAIRALNGQLASELARVNGIDTQITSIEAGAPMSAAVAGSGSSVVQNLRSRNMSAVGAAAVAGNLSVESAFNPSARGDWDPIDKKHTAFGLAQWRGSRWNELQAGTSNPWDTNAQLDFLMKELQRDYPKLYSRLMAGGEDVNTLTTAFMNEFERPNKDPSINHIGKRLTHAQSLAGVKNEANDAQIKENDAKIQTVVDENTAKSVKNASDATIKNLKARLGTLKTQAKINDDADSIAAIQKQVQDAHAAIEKAELEKFDAANIDLQKSDPGEYARQRTELQERLRENLNSDVLKIMEEHYKAAEEELNRPVDAAKNTLAAARQPDMANKYTSTEMQAMEQAVVDREREAATARVLLLEQQIAEVRRYAADAEKGGRSEEADMWRLQENSLIERNNELKAQNNALDAAKASNGPSVTSAIQSATNAWAQSNGILDANNKMIPMAKQVEATWGQVLDGLSSGFGSFFSNMTSGTMSAKDAILQLGQSVIQMFMQIIAKALANQVIMSLFGGSTGGGGGFMSGFLSVIGGGMMNGGIPRAANGKKASPFRDNVLVNVAPGEGILRKSAMDVIGEDGFSQMNNLGNRQVSEGALQGRASNDNSQQGSGQVNVWVVSQDQVPAMGPNDIIATVAQNIQQRGSIKQLIQQVQMGG